MHDNALEVRREMHKAEISAEAGGHAGKKESRSGERKARWVPSGKTCLVIQMHSACHVGEPRIINEIAGAA